MGEIWDRGFASPWSRGSRRLGACAACCSPSSRGSSLPERWGCSLTTRSRTSPSAPAGRSCPTMLAFTGSGGGCGWPTASGLPCRGSSWLPWSPTAGVHFAVEFSSKKIGVHVLILNVGIERDSSLAPSTSCRSRADAGDLGSWPAGSGYTFTGVESQRLPHGHVRDHQRPVDQVHEQPGRPGHRRPVFRPYDEDPYWTGTNVPTNK
jgi:hypothetical protein